MADHRMRLGFPVLLLLTALSLVLAPTPALAFPPSGAGDIEAALASQQNDRFGICFVSSAESPAYPTRYEKAVTAGARWTRWPIYWGNVERSPGYLDWSGVDQVVANDTIWGLNINAILLGTPSFFSTSGVLGVAAPKVGQRPIPLSGVAKDADKPSPASSTPRDLYQPIFADGTDLAAPGKTINPNNPWALFVHRAVSRYTPRIRYWEIWNEADYDLFWNGSVQDYYRLLKVAYIVIKFVDPGATVLLGGLAIYMKPNWLEDLLKVIQADPQRALRDANGSYFDVLPIHVYSTPTETEFHIRRVRGLLQKYGLGSKRIWVNESGVPVWNDYPGPTWDPTSPYRATMEEQAAYIWQNLAYGFWAGAERIFHFQLYDDCGNSPPGANDVGDAYGLYRNPSDALCFRSHPSPDSARPSYRAYQLAANYLSNATPLWRKSSQGDHEEIAFYRPGTRERVLFLWATRGMPASVQIAAVGSQALALDQDGNSQILVPTAGQYTVSLPAATNRNLPGQTSFMIGGRPLMLVEQDVTPPSAAVRSLPAYSPPEIAVSWLGSDEGSGVASYDVFVSVDNGPLVLWIQQTQATAATYSGVPGHSYGFAARATDRAGNAGALPTHPQTVTTVSSGSPSATPGTPSPTPTATRTPFSTTQVSGRVLNPIGQPVPGALVQISNAWGGSTVVHADGDGRWQIAGLPAGDYGVVAAQSGYQPWPPRRLQLQGVVEGFDVWLAPLVNLVQNGDFEAGLSGWSLGGSTSPQASESSFDGLRALVLGKDFVGQPELQGGGNSTLLQTVVLPNTTAPVYLSFRYKVTSQETQYNHDWFEVLVIDGTSRYEPLPPRAVWQSTAGWQQFAYDMSPWRGRSVQLIFNVWQDSSERPTLAYVDEVSVGSLAADAPTATPTATLTSTPAATPTPTATPTTTPTATATVRPRVPRAWLPVVIR